MDVFKSPVILGQLSPAELAALEADFIQYQSSNVIPDLFGRDALYDHPDVFLLMAILRPNAHDLARSRAVMLRLGEMAENFRKKW